MSQELEAAIAADPDDTAAYLVYSDWLQQQNDPRGDLIVLQHEGRTDAANQLLNEHARYFYGGLSDHLDLIEPTWHLGFIRACRVSLRLDRRGAATAEHERRILDALDLLPTLASARFLRELSVGMMPPYNCYSETIEILARHDLRTLTRLVLGDVLHAPGHNGLTSIGWTQPLYRSVPNLEALILHSGEEDADLGVVDLPKLTELRVHGCKSDWLPGFFAAPPPELVTLVVTGSGAWHPSRWTPLFDGNALPKLQNFGFGMESRLSGRLGELIANAPLVERLRTLDLSKSILLEPDIRAIAARPDAFRHLDHLDLGWLWAVEHDAALVASLRSLCRDVTLLVS